MKNESYARHKTHGLTGTRVYKTWESMKSRCYNKNDGKYEKYGGRGIRVCDEWLGENGAKNFAEWAYKNGFSEEKHQREQSIDRINVNGNYEPSNCRFTNAKVQANNRTNSVVIEFNGEAHTLKEWSEIKNIKEGTIRWRLNNGFTIGEALNQRTKKVSSTGKKYVTYMGKTKTVAEWSKETGIDVKILYARLRRKWTVERALTTPIGQDKWHK